MVTEDVHGLMVSGATVRFGPLTAVDDVSLEVAAGETVALLGPSGCGKSTLLRLVAGLEHGLGRISWNGDDLTHLPPDRRSFGLMFQDHALFPHRTVAENIAFGLRMARVTAGERQARTGQLLELVGLDGFGERSIDTLSGGEAQRVALARAVAPSPRLLMLDEPLGSLDRSLRDRLAADLRTVLDALGIAAIHVTHDQEEAYAVAERVVVMRAGSIERDGPATEVWADPQSEFVARFLGHRNVFDAATATALGLGSVPVVVREAAVFIDDGSDAPPAGASGPFPATVTDVRFRGATSLIALDLQAIGQPAALVVHRATPPSVAAQVQVWLDPTETAPLTSSS